MEFKQRLPMTVQQPSLLEEMPLLPLQPRIQFGQSVQFFEFPGQYEEELFPPPHVHSSPFVLEEDNFFLGSSQNSSEDDHFSGYNFFLGDGLNFSDYRQSADHDLTASTFGSSGDDEEFGEAFLRDISNDMFINYSPASEKVEEKVAVKEESVQLSQVPAQQAITPKQIEASSAFACAQTVTPATTSVAPQNTVITPPTARKIITSVKSKEKSAADVIDPMDMSPKAARKRPSALPVCIISKGESRRTKRKRKTPEQLAVLETEFDANPMPNKEVRELLSSRLGLTSRQVQIWFQNKRAKVKNSHGPPTSTFPPPRTAPTITSQRPSLIPAFPGTTPVENGGSLQAQPRPGFLDVLPSTCNGIAPQSFQYVPIAAAIPVNSPIVPPLMVPNSVDQVATASPGSCTVEPSPAPLPEHGQE